uniref:Uncharacterized protein n=1 Tax=Setaria viridis TaxID=4556 RepID=A0A4U6SQW7_SETVI|nr:hypothetical protein SEVIR_9G010450v2 [Setaria viridis]
MASYLHARPLFCHLWCLLCTDACMPGHVFIRSHQALGWGRRLYLGAAACLTQEEYWPLT